MNQVSEVKMAQRGVVVIPKSLRQAYGLRPGVRFTLLDLGGVFVLSPQVSRVDELANRIAQDLSSKGETLEGMLRLLREGRERYGP